MHQHHAATLAIRRFGGKTDGNFVCLAHAQKLTLYGSRLWNGPIPKPKVELNIDGCDRKALIHDGGLLLLDVTGQAVS